MTLGLQKISDVYDFFHPEIDQIARKNLRAVPFGSRRMWEFSMIFRALETKGKLNPQSRGLAMGAGTERLIYAIADEVAHVTVTDLYEMNGGWAGVRTTDPSEKVFGKAPWPIDRTKFAVMTMDMRDLKFPDDSFDFCWSTGSFEHIGTDEDFLKHFQEVERVLKPGGVYAFTTVVCFTGRTEAIPHNYYFDPNHLVDLIHASPLHPEPEFDCRLRDHIYNRPHPERFEDYGFPAADLFSKTIVSYRRGVLLAANVMVLTKDRDRRKVRPKIVGLKETSAQLKRQAASYVAKLWSEPQILVPAVKNKQLSIQPQAFGTGTVEIDAILPAGEPRSLRVKVESRLASGDLDWKAEGQGKVSVKETTFRFSTTADRIYRIQLTAAKETSLDRVMIRARRVD